MRPALVATDLDGTLLRADGTVSERTRAALVAVEAAGVPLVFVTGRPMRWMSELWSLVGDHGIAILSNGAVVYDVGAHELRRLRGIEPGPGLALVRALRAAVPGIGVGIELPSGLRVEPGFVAHHVEDVVTGPMEEVWDEPAVKLLARRPGLDPAALADAVTTAVGGAATVTWSNPGLLEISARDVTKASALAEVCASLDVAAADVVAFGDMPNDLAMLGWAGTSYAVANAHPTVLAAADHVAPHHDEDGVAQVLEVVVLGSSPAGEVPT